LAAARIAMGRPIVPITSSMIYVAVAMAISALRRTES
jgi:hypothetical protein